MRTMPSPTSNPPQFCSKVFLTYSYGQVKAKSYTPDSFSITFKMVISGTERERTLNLSTLAVYNYSHLHFLSTHIYLLKLHQGVEMSNLVDSYTHFLLQDSAQGKALIDYGEFCFSSFLSCKNTLLMLFSTITRCGRAGEIASFQERRRH